MAKVQHLLPGGGVDEGVRAALHDALSGVAYQHLDRERLAEMLSDALLGKHVLGDDAAFAAGTRNAVEAIDTVRVPVWATVLKPKWFRDFEAVREMLSDTARFVSRGDTLRVQKIADDLRFRKTAADVR